MHVKQKAQKPAATIAILLLTTSALIPIHASRLITPASPRFAYVNAAVNKRTWQPPEEITDIIPDTAYYYYKDRKVLLIEDVDNFAIEYHIATKASAPLQAGSPVATTQSHFRHQQAAQSPSALQPKRTRDRATVSGMSTAAGSWSGGRITSSLIQIDSSSIDVGSSAVPAAADLTGNGLADLLVANQSGTIACFEYTSSGVYRARDPANFAGRERLLDTSASISYVYSTNNECPTLLLSTSEGYIFRAATSLRGDFYSDVYNRVDGLDLAVFGDAFGFAENADEWKEQANLDLTPDIHNMQVIDALDLSVFGDSFGAQK
ncbi:MAG: hypothetical protein GF398_09200 [Chitinivibrionales bacterium]|nr:hypothetical protein [Chitinivibrionales bacterium]